MKLEPSNESETILKALKREPKQPIERPNTQKSNKTVVGVFDKFRDHAGLCGKHYARLPTLSVINPPNFEMSIHLTINLYRCASISIFF